MSVPFEISPALEELLSDKQMNKMFARLGKKVTKAHGNLIMRLTKEGIMPGMYTIESRIEGNNFILFAKLK